MRLATLILFGLGAAAVPLSSASAYGGDAEDELEWAIDHCDEEYANRMMDDLRSQVEYERKLVASGQESQEDLDEIVDELEYYERVMSRAFPCVGQTEAWVYGGIGAVRLPRTTIAFVRDGAYGSSPDKPGFRTMKWVAQYSFDGGVALSDRIRLTAGYAWAKGRDRFDYPAASNFDSGIVYGGLSPSGSSGIATPFGVSGEAKVDYDAWYVGGEFRAMTSPGATINLYGQFSHDSRDYRDGAWLSGDLYGNQYQASQDRSQSINEDRFEIGAKVGFSTHLTTKVVPYAWLKAGGYYLSSELRSTEHDTSNFGSPQDHDFTLEFDEKDHSLGFHGNAKIGVEFKLGPTYSLTLGAEGDYWSKAGAVWNPYSGDDVYYNGLTTQLRSEDMWSYKFLAGVKLDF